MLCDERGKATGIEQRLAPGDDPRPVAKRLKRQAWHRDNEVSAFHSRPLYYELSGLT